MAAEAIVITDGFCSHRQGQYVAANHKGTDQLSKNTFYEKQLIITVLLVLASQQRKRYPTCFTSSIIPPPPPPPQTMGGIGRGLGVFKVSRVVKVERLLGDAPFQLRERERQKQRWRRKTQKSSPLSSLLSNGWLQLRTTTREAERERERDGSPFEAPKYDILTQISTASVIIIFISNLLIYFGFTCHHIYILSLPIRSEPGSQR